MVIENSVEQAVIDLDILLDDHINELSKIQATLVEFGYEQYQINLAVKDKLDNGYTVVQQKNADFLVRV